MPPDPLKGPILGRKYFWSLRFQNQVVGQKPALKEYLVINVSYQWNINSFKKEERRELHIAYWQPTSQLSFHGQQEFHQTWFSPYIVQ